MIWDKRVSSDAQNPQAHIPLRYIRIKYGKKKEVVNPVDLQRNR